MNSSSLRTKWCTATTCSTRSSNRFFRENIGYSVGSMGDKLVMVLRMKDHSLDNFRRLWTLHGFDQDQRHMVRTWGRVQQYCVSIM